MSDTEEPRAGWRIEAWAKAVGISRAQAFVLVRKGAVRSAKVGSSRIILEPPREFLERHLDRSGTTLA